MYIQLQTYRTSEWKNCWASLRLMLWTKWSHIHFLLCTYVLLILCCYRYHWFILTVLARSCYVVVCGRGFTGGRVGALALRPLAGVLALSWLVLARLDRLLCLARPVRLVGGVHAAPHAAAKLQPPHVPNHGGGIERLLERNEDKETQSFHFAPIS